MRTERMEAGRELDALVAERVMGWVDLVYVIGYAPGRSAMDRNIFGAEVVPAYSTDIAAAWAVVERMRGLYWGFSMRQNSVRYGGAVHVSFGDGEAEADTAPLAICLAALASAHPEAPTLERAATGAAAREEE